MKTLSVSTYAAPREKIRQTLVLGQQKIEEAKVRTYWETGRLINAYLGKSEVPYQERGEQVVAKLAKDLGFGEKVFYRCMRFSEKFPNFSARRNLTWAHYRALIAVPDGKKRLALAGQAAKEEWSSRDLEIEIRNLLWDERAKASDGKAPSLLPVPVLGSFYTYKVIAPETIHSRATEPLLDVGFSGTKKLGQFTSRKFSSARAVKSSADGTWDMGHKYKSGTIVTSSKDARGKYSLREFRLQTTDDRQQRGSAVSPQSAVGSLSLYTYQAFVERIIDGDTLKLEIDTGFDDQKHETIRLKGIDCPELDTPEGQAVKRFVERELAHCDFIILKSTRTPRKEKWGRYLGDIFYTNKEGKQVYLNNLLLEKGYAVRVRE